MSTDMDNTAFDQLEFRSRLLVVWGFFWRGLVVTLGSAISGGIAGFLLGVLTGVLAPALGFDTSSEQFLRATKALGAVAGVAIGLTFFWHYVRWLFHARYGGLRLALVRDPPSAV